MVTILIVILILILGGALPTLPHSKFIPPAARILETDRNLYQSAFGCRIYAQCLSGVCKNISPLILKKISDKGNNK
jgi:hypothetical protein